MKLLFDESLSPRLVELLKDLFPGSESALCKWPRSQKGSYDFGIRCRGEVGACLDGCRLRTSGGSCWSDKAELKLPRRLKPAPRSITAGRLLPLNQDMVFQARVDEGHPYRALAVLEDQIFIGYTATDSPVFRDGV